MMSRLPMILIFLIGGLQIASVLASEPASAILPLKNAHAHNDYEHKRPLRDALDCGFCSIEADVFLMDGKLLVGHTPFNLKPDRTLEALYLDPLRELARSNNGRVYPHGPTIFLLIDVKSDAEKTYAVLVDVLARYDDIFSVTNEGKFEAKAVTAVISGNRDLKALRAATLRYAGIDGRPSDLDSEQPADLLPWISENWNTLFRWRGEGAMPEEERNRLREFVARAHHHGRLVRFWATPEKETVWKELRAAGVDLIGTDRIEDLKSFLLLNDRTR